MTKDLNKGISSISYNLLNLPQQVDILSPLAEARNAYSYSADGVKLRVVKKYNSNIVASPIICLIDQGMSSGTTQTTDYVGNKLFENNVLDRIFVDGGYIKGGVYYFYETDHLGDNRTVINQSGTVVERNDYYPFGMQMVHNQLTNSASGSDNKRKFGGKELDVMGGLNLYDFSARSQDPTLGRFTTVDPKAEKYYSISPYAYCADNPLRFVDATGMEYGDFIDEKGNVIGNDGIDDEKLYAIKTDASKESKKYIKDNSGNANAFRDAGNIAYQNSIEVECNSVARQDMVNEISKDNGKGGTSAANNREYGGSIENGTVITATPGAVANPKTSVTANIELPSGVPTFHSHPSGEIVEAPPANTFGGTKYTYSFNQTPSPMDINAAGSNTHYVFGRSDSKVYVYTSGGVQAVIPLKQFVTPKPMKK